MKPDETLQTNGVIIKQNFAWQNFGQCLSFLLIITDSSRTLYNVLFVEGNTGYSVGDVVKNFLKIHLGLHVIHDLVDLGFVG